MQLFLAIRCQNWKLHISSLKLMVPLFSAYDRTTYQRLIPIHLADIQKFPPKILQCLKKGFTVSIKGEKGHAIALDEAHETLDLKMAISYPYIQKTSLFMKYRITAHKALVNQLFPPQVNAKQQKITGIFSEATELKHKEENIKIRDAKPIPHNQTINRGLINIFSGVAATPEQSHDLLNFREIDISDVRHYINFYVLKKPSIDAPIRKHKLLTMGSQKKSTKRSLDQKQRGLGLACETN